MLVLCLFNGRRHGMLAMLLTGIAANMPGEGKQLLAEHAEINKTLDRIPGC